MDLNLSVRGLSVEVLPQGDFPGGTLRNQDSIYIQVDPVTGKEAIRKHAAHPFAFAGGWALTCVIKGRTARIHVLTWSKKTKRFIHRLHYSLFRDGTYRVTPRRVNAIDVVPSPARKASRIRRNFSPRPQRAACY